MLVPGAHGVGLSQVSLMAKAASIISIAGDVAIERGRPAVGAAGPIGVAHRDEPLLAGNLDPWVVVSVVLMG